MAWWWIEVKLFQRADKVVVASLAKLAREQDLEKRLARRTQPQFDTGFVAVLWRPTSSLSPEKPVWTFDGTATNYNSISPPQDTRHSFISTSRPPSSCRLNQKFARSLCASLTMVSIIIFL